MIAGARAALIANDVTDFRYRAHSAELAPGAATEAQSNPQLETQMMIDTGMVEVMIGGASAVAFAGDFVRVPAGVLYACRNTSDEPASLLIRTVSPGPAMRAVLVNFDWAA
ncbi:MAG: cupin domain-containing protein [Devosia sp.]